MYEDNNLQLESGSTVLPLRDARHLKVIFVRYLFFLASSSLDLMSKCPEVSISQVF